MLISPVNQNIMNYNLPVRISRHNYYTKNSEPSDAISFKRTQYRLDTTLSGLGIILGSILIVMFGVTKCHNSGEESNVYKGKDREYYHQIDSNYIDSIAMGLDDTITLKQAEQRERLINGKDSILKDFLYETSERDFFENIFLNRIDSVTRPSTRNGKDIMGLEEVQVFMDLEDSIKTKYPNKEINARL